MGKENGNLPGGRTELSTEVSSVSDGVRTQTQACPIPRSSSQWYLAVVMLNSISLTFGSRFKSHDHKITNPILHEVHSQSGLVSSLSWIAPFLNSFEEAEVETLGNITNAFMPHPQTNETY